MNAPPFHYRCSNPDHPAGAPAVFEEMSTDGFCPHCAFGEGVLEAIAPEEARHPQINGGSGPARHSGEIGLCILPCDVSGSMFDECFPGNPARTIDLVSRAAAAGITDLYSLSNAHDAYIAILPFAEDAQLLSDNGQPFFFSISEIKGRYPTAEALNAFLSSAFESTLEGGSTDFNKPLALAREIYDLALGGSLGAYGGPEDFVLKTHDLIDMRSGQTVSIPNLRILLYSDGEHNAEELNNPFVGEAYSPLLTMFFGQQGADGARQMQDLACTCPQHDRPGFFLVDAPASYATLRHLFRMASGTSGFCPECSRIERIEQRRAAA